MPGQRHVPEHEQGLAALVKKPDRGEIPRNWKAGGYLDKLPVDPWQLITVSQSRHSRRGRCVLARRRPQARWRGFDADIGHGSDAHALDARARGFTLIELLVVVAIIVIIVALAGVQLMRGPATSSRRERALALLLRAARRRRSCRTGVRFGAGRESYRFLRWSATAASK